MRKALGATPYSIVSMIVQEAILITGVAGYLGLLAGVGLLYGLDSIMAVAGADVEYFKHPQVNFGVAGAAVVVLVIAGALAGLFPALRAARVPPVEALRTE
ncbi:MAG: ABC transporter permease [Saprospiraceae bacterium]|nr:ABC transporter permease [Saprospiraceae bacterium]